LRVLTRACLGLALAFAGAMDEAMATSEGLVDAAEATDNPYVVCFGFLAYGFARRDADPAAAYDALRRGLGIAHDSGNRLAESILASVLSRWAATHGDPTDAFDYMTLAISNYHDSGNFAVLRSPLAALATLLYRLEHHEPAATISGFAATPFTRTAYPETTTAMITRLREVLGEQRYESLTRKGGSMTPAAITKYAYDQIDQARTELNTVAK
jgi:hypothetical protein